MVLADTSVLITQFRNPLAKRSQLIVSIRPVVCGVTIAELFTGTRTAAQLATTNALLSIFGRVSIPDSVWELVGHHNRRLIQNGLVISFPDVVIATLAIDQNFELWTYDNHYSLIAAILPGLTLYAEPP